MMFITDIRRYKIALFMAESAGELSPDLKKHLYGELLQAAGIVEVRE